jgi:hypothetical protein
MPVGADVSSLMTVRRCYLGLQFVLGLAMVVFGVTQFLGITAFESSAAFFVAVGLSLLGLGGFLLRESSQPVT